MTPGLLDEPRTWFMALGAPVGPREQTAIAGYLRGFSLSVAGPVRTVSNWEEAADNWRAVS